MYSSYLSLDGLKDTTQALLLVLNKKKKTLNDNNEEKTDQVKIILTFKIYIYDASKKIIQM